LFALLQILLYFLKKRNIEIALAHSSFWFTLSCVINLSSPTSSVYPLVAAHRGQRNARQPVAAEDTPIYLRALSKAIGGMDGYKILYY
jgi:hypothetical protein